MNCTAGVAWYKSHAPLQDKLKGQTHLLSPARDLDSLELAQDGYFCIHFKEQHRKFQLSKRRSKIRADNNLGSKICVQRNPSHSAESVNLLLVSVGAVGLAPSLAHLLSEPACKIKGLEVTGHKTSPLLCTFIKPDTIPTIISLNSHKGPIRGHCYYLHCT